MTTARGISLTGDATGSVTFDGSKDVAILVEVNDADTVDGKHASDFVLAGYGVPAGAVQYFAMQIAPSGWLVADGSAISRATYADLFNAIGTTYGKGDDCTTFNLPDLRGEFIRGWDHGKGNDSSRAFGSFQTDSFQGHSHSIGWAQSFGWGSGVHGSRPASEGYWASEIVGTPVTDGVNGTPRTANETRPRNVALLACIKC